MALTAAPALADSSLTQVKVTSGPALVGVAVDLSFAGELDDWDTSTASGAVYADINLATVPCAATHDLNHQHPLYQTAGVHTPIGVNPYSASDAVRVASGPFTDAKLSWTPHDAGDYLVCTYLTADFETVAAVVSTPVTARQPTATLSIALAGTRFALNAPIDAQVTSSAQVPGRITVVRARAGKPCPATVSAWTSTSKKFILSASTPTPSTQSGPVPAADKPGHFHLCGYLTRVRATGVAIYQGETLLLATAEGPTFWIGDAHCGIGRSPASRAGSVTIRCWNTDGAIQLVARHGKKRVTRTKTIVGDTVTATGAELGLSRGKKTTVTVIQGGQRLGTRRLALRS